MTDNVFFTSDTHFGHTKMLQIRTMFKTVEEMDEAMIENWNAVVGKHDRIYHLVDFGFCQGDGLEKIRKRLNGNVFLVLGNHDKLNGKQKALFGWVKDHHYFKVGDQKVFLFHYACLTWRTSHKGSWMLHGHSHGNLADDPNALRLDAGVDCWDFFPIGFEQVAERMKMKTFKAVDHHVLGLDESED